MVSDDRGQLILVGAVAIALVILGLVLVVNTALFTQVVGSEGTVETTKDGGLAAEEVGDSIAAVVAAENERAAGPASDATSDIDGRVEAEVDDHLEPGFRTRSVETGGSYVSLDYTDVNENGTRVTQDAIRPFTSDTGAGDWAPIPSGGDVGGFFLTIYTNESAGVLDIVLANSTASRTLELSYNPISDTVTVDGPDTPAACSGVEPTADTVRVDVSNGRVFEDSACSFDLFGSMRPGYSLEFTSAGINGTYSFVTDSDLTTTNPDYGDTSSDPGLSNAIWSFEYASEYDTGGATVESDSRVVDVYD